MGYITTDLLKTQGRQIPNVVYAGEILAIHPSVIKEKFLKTFCNSNISFFILNNEKDIYIGTKKDINFFKLDNLQAFCDAMGFMYEFCKKGQCSQIEERFLQFPNSFFCMRYMTTCQVSDPMNKLMITVKSKKIKEGNSIILKISFPSDILKIAKEQLHKITEDWLEEAFSIGYNQEIIKLSEGAFIKGNGYIKMIFDYTGLVHFPFLELFLRLNTLPLEIRPISMSFS